MSSRGKKRPPSLDGSSPRRRRRRRPDSTAELQPPPPPPEPLVQLLQSNKDVLAYFQSLKANLDADVQRWKDRAASYKEKYEQLLSQQSHNSPKASKKASTKNVTKKNDSGRKAVSRPANVASEKKSSNDGLVAEETTFGMDSDGKTSVPPVKEVSLSIDEAIFDALEEESSDESIVSTPAAEMPESVKLDDLHETFNLLWNAYKSLKEVGVSLVIEEVATESTDGEENATSESNVVDRGTVTIMGDKETAIEASEKVTTRVLHRRSDQEVVSDLMRALRTVTRIHLLAREAKAYQPFAIPSMIPCCYSLPQETSTTEQPHPSVNAMSCVFYALSTMRAYCGDLPNKKWDDLFSNENKIDADAIRIGMRNRQTMVDLVFRSLYGEISNAWAVLDRSSRLITTAQHYEQSSTDDADKALQMSTKDPPFEGFGPKSQSRLASLAERCIHAQLICNTYHNRKDPQEVSKLVWNYLLCSAPSLGVEDYPRLPPVLSLCILEALLHRNKELLRNKHEVEDSCSENQTCWFSRFLNHFSNKNRGRALTSRAVALAIHTTAQIWKRRLQSEDDRITDISRVEVACYERLLKSESLWLERTNGTLSQDGCRQMAMSIIDDSVALLLAEEETKEGTPFLDATLGLQLSLTIVGDHSLIKDVFNRSIASFQRSLAEGCNATNTSGTGFFALVVACCASIRQIQIRQIDSYHLKHGSLQPGDRKQQTSLCLDEMAKLLLECRVPPQHFWTVVSSTAKCCVQLAHGETLHRVCHWLVKNNPAGESSATTEDKMLEGESDSKVGERIPLGDGVARRTIAQATATLMDAGQVPTVRVINLRRRPDRMVRFFARAQQEQILVVRAVASLTADVEHTVESISQIGDYYWGLHAFDGQGRAAEVDSRLSNEIGEVARLSALVSTHWRPNDLKAFDKDARDDEALVMSSPSERACALSHVASWKGVFRSLSIPAVLENRNATTQDKLFRHPENLARLFRVSGFAHGSPLLIENERMPPTPVCVILEDDAILVDRFADRLESVLEELPRDFHFCSLGYSRPKTAPMVKYSSQLGIPTCTWYLTGYVLSLEGAKFLIDSLPVNGPVDSWIGLKMCANWDNVFGHRIGVGVHSLPLADLPPRKDLVNILKFRSFAALVPLCSQKVGATSTAGTVGRTWRQRDTDITYSGNS